MIIVAAGSSLPFNRLDSQQIVTRAYSALGSVVTVTAISPLYRSPAWPDPSDPPFINAVALVETNIGPSALLAALHTIEAGFGRVRAGKNAPRSLDLDIIAYGQLYRDEGPGVQLPHPRMQDREFVLAPLCDLAPDWCHPKTGKSAAQMLSALSTRSAQKIVEKKQKAHRN